jgi:hypothetical protein
MTSLTPKEIVSELDRFIIGHNKAKRARHRSAQSLETAAGAKSAEGRNPPKKYPHDGTNRSRKN